MRRVLRERPYVIQNRIVDGVPGGCRVHRDDFPQPFDAVEFALRPPGLADAVAVDDHTIAGNKYRIRRRESRARDQPYRHTGGLERPDPPIRRNDQRRAMTRVDVAKPAILPQGAIKDSGVFLHFRPLDQKTIDQLHGLLNGMGAVRHRRERPLQVASQQRGTDALAGNVGHRHRPAVVVHIQHVKVIAAHLQRGHAAPAGHKPAHRGKAARIQALLNLPRHIQLFLDFLLAALFFE